MASSTKRSWKLHFVAHGAKVRCLALGHKSGRVLVTGGDDKLVNLWAVGKPNCIMSLTGNAAPIECVQFGNTEELVVSGAANGSLRIWDLEAAKMVRTLQGHKGALRCTHFHPYGDFLASGSVDKSVKLWDIRRKGCIYTYEGHRLTVNSVKFSPDGQWIASGSDDGTVKLWDLRAGRMLTEFVDQGGGGGSGGSTSHSPWGGKEYRPVTCVEFHPHEFLLASGTSHRIVKFWDLENLSLVSMSERDPSNFSPVRCLLFSEGGECLYSGSEDVLRVLDWEPAYTYHSLHIGWSQVWDVAIAQNQLIGAAFHSTNVVLYVVDLKGLRPQDSPIHPMNAIPVTESASSAPQIISATTQSTSNAPSVLIQTPEKSSEPPISPFSHGQTVRKSFNKERPPPGSKHRLLVKTIEESDKSGTDPEDESLPVADIKDVGDYQAIFQPNRALCRTPPPDPFPAPLDDDPAIPQVLQPPPEETSHLHHHHHSLEYNHPASEPTKEPPPVTRNNRMPSPKKEPSQRRNSVKDTHSPYNFQETDFPVKLSSIKHSPSEPALNKANAFHSRSNSLSRTFVGVQTGSIGARGTEVNKNPPPSSSGKQASQSLPPYPGVSRYKLNTSEQHHSVSATVSGPSSHLQRHSPPTSRPPTAPSSPKVVDDFPPVQYFGKPSVSHQQIQADVRTPVAEISAPLRMSFITPSLDNITSGIHSMKVEDEDLVVPMSSDKPSGLDMDDFLPMSYKQNRFGVGMGGHGLSSPYPELSETEVFSSLLRGYEPMMAVLGARHRALQIIFSIWNTKDMKTAIDSAVEMKDASVLVDILGVLSLKPSVWNLDLCVSLLPSIHELLKSKYEMYMRVGVDALRLILRNFTPVIRTHVMGPAPGGVDIPREERYRKCMACYEHLVSIRSFLLKRQTLQGKLGQSFRELHVQMQSLDSMT